MLPDNLKSNKKYKLLRNKSLGKKKTKQHWHAEVCLEELEEVNSASQVRGNSLHLQCYKSKRNLDCELKNLLSSVYSFHKLKILVQVCVRMI